MNLLQHVRDFLAPKRTKCNDSAVDNAFDPMSLDDEMNGQLPRQTQKVPGFEGLFNPVLMVTANPQMIRGFKFQFSLPLSEYFNFSHSWLIPNAGSTESNPMNPMMPPTTQKASYTFTTQLVRDIRGQEPYTIMMGKAEGDGKVDGIFMKRFNKNLMLKLTGSFQNSNLEQGVISADLQIEGKNSMSVFRAGPGHLGFNTMHRIHPNLMLGFDYTNLTMQKLAFFSYGAKTSIGRHNLFAQYIGIQDQYNLGYIIPLHKGSQFVAQYKYEGREKKTSTALGFKQRYSLMDILATLDSKGQISTNIFIKELSYGLRLCASADFLKDKYSFGYGITLGQVM